MTQLDPERWLSSAQAPLAAHEREALRALSLRGPDQAARARMFERLAHATLVAAGSPSPTPVRTRSWWWWWVAGAALTALLFSVGSLRPSAVIPAAPAPREVAESVAAAPSAPAQARLAAPSSPAPIEALPAPVRARSTRARAARTEQGAVARDPGAELAILAPARQVLAVEPARALALANQHAQRFPRGVFSEERAFLRIEALVRLGRQRAAEQDARAFLRAHPASTYRERLKLLLPALD